MIVNNLALSRRNHVRIRELKTHFVEDTPLAGANREMENGRNGEREYRRQEVWLLRSGREPYAGIMFAFAN